jgi:hypothetical protein
MELNQTPDTKVQPQVIYRAVGRSAGTYQPSLDNVNQGVFITSDGFRIPAFFTWQFRGRLKHRYPDIATQPDFFQQYERWTVYPKTEPKLQFHLTGMKLLTSETVNAAQLDEFRVVGQIQSCNDEKIVVCIQRNENLPGKFNKAKDIQSFTLSLDGSLPPDALGQIWDIKVNRVGERLVVVAGQPYVPSEEDKTWLEQNVSKKALALAAKKVDSKVADAKTKPRDDQSKASVDNKAASESGISIPLEEVARNSIAIAIAEESSPMAATDRAPQEQQKKQSVSQFLTTTEAGTDLCESGSKPKHKADAASHQAAMIRPVQQRQQKTSISPSSQHSPTDSRQLPVLKSGAAASKPNAQHKKPTFQVKVNDQVFSGYDSVTLNNRMLRIDGLAVAQAKMVIVVGQPQSMQADGKVTQKDNSAVLTSK